MTTVEATIASVWKAEAAKLIGGLARMLRDVSLAEELAQDALVIALEQWPRSGIPQNPGAWLMTTAKNRALNELKRSKRSTERQEIEAPPATLEAAEARMDSDVNDDVLRLLFAACHPVLPKEARVALTLRMVGGLTTAEIARAFLSTEPTVAQRVVRAKKTLGEARVPFEVPRGEELSPRLASVLEVVYLIFNEGYSATAGEDLMRPALMDEALRLAELLAILAPSEPEVHALQALLLLQSSRQAARVDEHGDPVLLTDQDRSKWDRAAIDSGLRALSISLSLRERLHQPRLTTRDETVSLSPVGERVGERARTRRDHSRTGSHFQDRVGVRVGPYALQAELAACHARAATAGETDWERIAQLYSELAELLPSPVIELNRAVAISRARGAEAGLALLDALRNEPALARYHLLPAARADLLDQLGRREEAREEFSRAAGLAENARQRERLEARAAKLK